MKIIKPQYQLIEGLYNLIDYAHFKQNNPFIEARLVGYATDGLNKLHNLKLRDDDALIKMYEEHGHLLFEIVV